MKIITVLPCSKLTLWNHEDLVGLFKKEEGKKQLSKKARTRIDHLHFWPCYTALNTTTPSTLTIFCNSTQPPHLETTWRASFWPVAIPLAFIPRTPFSCLFCDLWSEDCLYHRLLPKWYCDERATFFPSHRGWLCFTQAGSKSVKFRRECPTFYMSAISNLYFRKQLHVLFTNLSLIPKWALRFRKCLFNKEKYIIYVT